MTPEVRRPHPLARAYLNGGTVVTAAGLPRA